MMATTKRTASRETMIINWASKKVVTQSPEPYVESSTHPICQRPDLK